ncbi:unnamed protein product [Cochlearia groenlandica]
MPLSDSDDFGDFMRSCLSHSRRPDHDRLCAVIEELSKTLADDNHSRTPVAYFLATCVSLDSLFLSAESEPCLDVVQPHVVILSFVFPKVSSGVLRRNGLALRLVLCVLRLKSATPECLIPGLKCFVHLLTNVESILGSEGSESYNILLNFVTHSDGKVRKLANSCLRDVLQKSHATKAWYTVSGAVADLFQKYLDLTTKSDAGSSERANGAQQVVYILSTLKECLALMSKKHIATLIEGLKVLMSLRVPFIIMPVIDSLNAVCLNPASDVPVEALVQVLSLAATLFSGHETSADAMTCTARLLKVGMTRAFTLNRDVCVAKLPSVFNGLKEIIASEHEEAIFAATDTLKSLIFSCIDESLIREGVNEIRSSQSNVRTSSPTVIEKLCSIVESLLHYKYNAVWDMSFHVISGMFDKLGEDSKYFMRKTLEDLSDMQDLPDEGFPFRKQVRLLLEMLIKKCGIEAVKSMMPEEHMKLLTNIRKVKERKEKKYAAGSDISRSQVSRWNDTKIFSDFADEDEDSDGDYMDAESRSRSKASSLLKDKESKRKKNQSHLEVDESDDEPLDLMDRYKTRSALRSSELRKRKADSDEEPEYDDEGLLIIHEGEKTKRKELSDADSFNGKSSRFSVNSSSKKNQKRIKRTSESGSYAYTGKEYASKKASGDLTRKDKFEPYAYWPLDRKMMSHRPDQRAVAVRCMSSVVKMAKSIEGKSAAEALATTTKVKQYKRSVQKKSSGKKKTTLCNAELAIVFFSPGGKPVSYGKPNLDAVT